MSRSISHQASLTSGYAEYHQKVVNACAALMGEAHRHFFDSQCSYEEEFANGIAPEEVAQDQLPFEV